MNKGALEDRYAKIEITKLIEEFSIKRIIETGTYKGWSTKEFATLCDNIDTIEINLEYIEDAYEFLKDVKNVKIHNGSSPEVMKNIISNGEKDLLIFLDAHWEKYWPVKDELIL
jgi:predicted O-methyltransferase YrrM